MEKEIVCGSIAGMVSQFVVYPFDVIRTRMQTSFRNYNSVFDCVRTTFFEEGILGFYKGMASPLIAQVFYKSTIFGTTAFLQKKLHPDGARIPLSSVFFTAAIAGGVNCIWVTPAELVRNRIQVHFKGKLSPVQVISKSFHELGLKSLWKGMLPTMVRDVPGVGVWFCSFEFFKNQLFSNNSSSLSLNGFSKLILCGSAAGMAYWSVVYPFDVVKSVLQTQPHSEPIRYFSTVLNLYKEGGISRFYRGFMMAFLRGIPSSGTLFTTYVMLSELYNKQIQQ